MVEVYAIISQNHVSRVKYSFPNGVCQMSYDFVLERQK
jgi:hypothetical protein